MFCKFCGEKNTDRDNYCIKCGTNLNDNYSMSRTSNFIEENNPFCKNCGCQSADRYCTQCGSGTYKLMPQQGIDFKIESIKNIKSIADATFTNKKLIKQVNIKESFNEIANDRELITNSLIATLKIMSIGVFISVILFMLITNIDAVKELQNSYKYIPQSDSVQKLRMAPNALDLFNMSFQSSWFLEGSAKIDGYNLGIIKVKIDLALLILLLIPFIAIFISQFKLFKNGNSTARNIKEYLLTAVFFSSLLTIIMLFNRKAIIMTEDYSNSFINMSGSFGIISNFTMVLLITFLMQLIISIFVKKEKLFDIIANDFFNNIMGAITVFLKNLSYITVLCLFALIAYMLYISFTIRSITTIFLLIPNIFIAVWLFISGNKFVFSIPGEAYPDLSIWSTWNGIVRIQDLFYVKFIDALPLYLLIILILLGVLFVLVQAIQKLSQENFFKHLLAFASGLTIINLIMAFFTRLYIDFKIENTHYLMEVMEDIIGLPFISANQSIIIGFSLFDVGMITFFSVLIVGGLIYLLSSQNLYIKINDFMVRKERPIKIGYGLTLLGLFVIIAVKITDYYTYIKFFF